MQRLFFYILILTFLTFATKANNVLSPSAKISLLTCSPGVDAYSLFGHSALRIVDTVLKIDKVYNYGTFSFNTPNFYWKFFQGKLDYQLSVSSYSHFLKWYEDEQRAVAEQVLNLTEIERQKVYNYLEWNFLPENRYYRYEFFYDNCATRIRDIFLADSIFGNRVVFPKNETTQSFRDMIQPYLKNSQWVGMGLNLILGYRADKVADYMEVMFLPDYMAQAFENATILHNGSYDPFLTNTFIVLPAIIDEPENFFLYQPYFVFSMLILLVLTAAIWGWMSKRRVLFFDYLLLTISGLVGVLIILLWSATEHRLTVWNWNLLWFFPLNIFIIFLMRKKSLTRFHYIYFVFTNAMLISRFFIPQGYDLGLVLLSFAYILHAASSIRSYSK